MPLLSIENLKKTYRSPDGTTHVVLDVPQFALEDSEQVGLAGSSGSGKTTLLNVIAGILKPDTGRILLDGDELTALSEPRRDSLRARRIGYVFQTFNLLQGYTALENVEMGMMFGKGVDRDRARDLLQRLGLGERLDYRPSQLSIGQQQRVALARALANHPRLVLADEPTGNLDVHHAGEALGMIQDACREQEAALLLVSHDREILGRFERSVDLATINRAAAPAPAGGEATP